jgi:hypothetical protein
MILVETVLHLCITKSYAAICSVKRERHQTLQDNWYESRLLLCTWVGSVNLLVRGSTFLRWRLSLELEASANLPDISTTQYR